MIIPTDRANFTAPLKRLNTTLQSITEQPQHGRAYHTHNYAINIKYRHSDGNQELLLITAAKLYWHDETSTNYWYHVSKYPCCTHQLLHGADRLMKTSNALINRHLSEESVLTYLADDPAVAFCTVFRYPTQAHDQNLRSLFRSSRISMKR